ncbi:DNA polymerase III subunit delta [Vibrio hannami]|uniref:DNA polymerase III subunit delta n=1 Tax=Vibrio hannami TaxID=2717094 RepID=UPI00240FE35C|nr:DNA polymerase III subunit delta [Vibrio hannami]MDG3087415.1 DNA polymerase III subunit delta [Vibrio hannami]
MRIFADKLADNLSRNLSGIYLVFGNEPLLLLESRDQIFAAATKAGFDEKHQFVVDSSINWNEVYDCCQAMSLFSSKKVIELEIPESGINAGASKELVALSEYLNEDIILLLTGSKLTKQQENAKWFKTFNQKGIWVSCLTPDIQRLPGFIQSRCFKLGLKPDPEALQMLAQWHEGNLLALSQGLEKLALLYPDGVLTLVRIEESLSRHNHFTPFHWMDAVLAGKPNRALRILRQLEAEGVELIILLRTLQKEIQLLLQLKQESQKLANPGMLFDKYRIWQSKRSLYNAALNRLSYKNLTDSYKLLTKLEIQTKTQYENSGWLDINRLSIELCSPDSLLPLTVDKG